LGGEAGTGGGEDWEGAGDCESAIGTVEVGEKKVDATGEFEREEKSVTAVIDAFIPVSLLVKANGWVILTVKKLIYPQQTMKVRLVKGMHIHFIHSIPFH
jgi:hypothetical protein